MSPRQMTGEGGIKTVVGNYIRILESRGYEFVDSGADVDIVHAGVRDFQDPAGANVAVLHGLYWTGSTNLGKMHWVTNRRIVETMRYALAITVPSEWVSLTIERDMGISPFVIPHGVDFDLWNSGATLGDFVISFGKNRMSDGISPFPAVEMHTRFPQQKFVATMMPDGYATPNVLLTGVVPHNEWREVVKKSLVVMSTAQETFGLVILEAMAAGKPVLAFANGGANELIQHGVTGYLAAPDDLDDLERGLQYCIQYADVLGANGAVAARGYTWERAVDALEDAIAYAVNKKAAFGSSSIIIPVHNKEGQIAGTIASALTQGADEILVGLDKCTDGSAQIVREIASTNPTVSAHDFKFGNVADTRNALVAVSSGDIIITLDGDDQIDGNFLEIARGALGNDNSLAIAYPRLKWIRDGKEGESSWPQDCNPDAMLKRKNQIPSMSAFRRDVWERVGGWRRRYCPTGAGSEDADFWLRALLAGMRAKLVTNAPMHRYLWEGATTQQGYVEPDWVGDKRAARGSFPFAALMTPDNGVSHPIPHYDDPLVDIVIPVGTGHKQLAIDAVDSVFEQTFQSWRLTVVWDTPVTNDEINRLVPHKGVHHVRTKESYSGAGVARNLGASMFNAPLLLFLDADDFLDPDALSAMVSAFAANGKAVSTDYYGMTVVSKEEAERSVDQFVSYNEQTSLLVTIGKFRNFDRELAISQPTNPPFVWCPVNTLIKREWFNAVGGFDEELESWEDWHFYIKLARAGVDFFRIERPLFTYRFFSGTRRRAALADKARFLTEISQRL